jgi:hypothetical protein
MHAPVYPRLGVPRAGLPNLLEQMREHVRSQALLHIAYARFFVPHPAGYQSCLTFPAGQVWQGSQIETVLALGPVLHVALLDPGMPCQLQHVLS